MVYRIEVGLKHSRYDARGRSVKIKAAQALNLALAAVQTRTVYKIDAALSRAELKALRQAFADPVLERAALGRLRAPRCDWLIEVGFQPGVTDNLARAARVALQTILGRDLALDEDVYSAIQYFVRGKAQRPTVGAATDRPTTAALTRAQIESLAKDLLANPLINTIEIFSAEEWQTRPPDASLPAIREEPTNVVHSYDLSGSDEDLKRLSQVNILSLGLEEMHAIRDYFATAPVRAARQALGLPEQPSDVELECIAQTWSEHCSHKIFAARIHYIDESGQEQWIDSLFNTYIKAATKKISEQIPWLVSVFTDNAGIIRCNERLNLVYKVETHNSPSALDPYGGAMTGIVGVNRDPMGTGIGATMFCNVWGYCLGSPFYQGHLPEGLMHPRRIRDGAHQGAIEGGNQSGLPAARGWEIFDDRFIGKPLVFCGTVGTLPLTVQGCPTENKDVQVGDSIVMLGGKIGKDGIHGATFSSEELKAEAPVQAVQIGDPIAQRMMYELLIEARDLGLYRCITDNGAGGLSCSVGEMGRLSGGADLDLARAPLKYAGLKPWEILLSEAQERMTLAVAPDKIDEFLALAKRREVPATVLGSFTDSGIFLIRHGDKVVGRLDMDFLYRGCPIMTLEARWTPPQVPEPQPLRGTNRTRVLSKLLASLNICSKEYKSRQYDGEVKGLSTVRPYLGVQSDIPSDAAILRLDYSGHEGVMLAEGINPFYSDLDTYWMAAAVIDEAVRRIISAGGALGTIAGLDNFCWPDPVESDKTPDGRYKLAQLVRANQALYDVTTAYQVPCISGKDSCKNDSTRGGRKISIPPTLLFSSIATMKDLRLAVTMEMKQAGDRIYAIGLTHNELGASAYHRLLAEQQAASERVGGTLPRLNTAQALAIYSAMNKATQRGLLRSSHTPTRGGLAVALALSALGGNLGAIVDLSKAPADSSLTNDALLFAESNSRFIVSVAPQNSAEFESLFAGLPCAAVGEVTADQCLIVSGRRGQLLIQAELTLLRKAFKETLYGL